MFSGCVRLCVRPWNFGRNEVYSSNVKVTISPMAKNAETTHRQVVVGFYIL